MTRICYWIFLLLFILAITTAFAQNPQIINLSDNSVNENDAAAYCNYNLDIVNRLSERIVVRYMITPGTALNPADYATSGSDTLTAYVDIDSTSGRLGPISPVDDSLWETNETVTMTITSAYLESSRTPVTVLDNSATLTIIDNDGAPKVISVSDTSSTESGLWNFTVSLDKANNSGERIVLEFTVGNSLGYPMDYQCTAPTSGSKVYIEPGGTKTTIGPVVIIEDTIYESDIIIYTKVTAAYTETTHRNLTITDNTGTGTILNDDPIPRLTLVDTQKLEGNPPTATVDMPVTFTFSNKAADGVFIDIQTSNNTATLGTDYQFTPRTILLPANQSTVTISAQIKAVCDSVLEPDETFYVIASNARFFTPGFSSSPLPFDRNQAVFTIQNDDPLPTLTLQSQSGSEGGGAINNIINLNIANTTGERIVVEYTIAANTALESTDYTTPGSGTLTGYIAIGAASGQITTITPLADELWEIDETATITISSAYLETSHLPVTLATGTANATITDATIHPRVTHISDTSSTESGLWNFTESLDKANNSGERIVLEFTVGNSLGYPMDYQCTAPPSGSKVYIEPGGTKTTIGPVMIIEDTIYESDIVIYTKVTAAYTETTHRNLTITDNTGTGTILNDDPIPRLTLVDTQKLEGNPPTATVDMPVTFTFSNKAADGVFIDIQTSNNTATLGTDYQFTPRTILLPANQSTVTISSQIKAVCDSVLEPDETFYVIASNARFFTPGFSSSPLPFDRNQAVFTIQNDEPVPSLRLSVHVFLEGAYQADGHMRTNLSTSHWLPTTSPYSSAPAESNNITAEIVDWILLELRQDIDGPVLLQRSVLLRNDGYLVDVDGSSTELKLTGLASGNYYLVINHRNHLAIMSATAVKLALDTPSSYDFTASADKIFGSKGGKEVHTGIWGMWAGDVDQDGTVNISDYAIWGNSAKLGEKGYRTADFDCDGQVTTADYFHWYSNQRENAMSQVPALAP